MSADPPNGALNVRKMERRRDALKQRRKKKTSAFLNDVNPPSPLTHLHHKRNPARRGAIGPLIEYEGDLLSRSCGFIFAHLGEERRG